MTDVNVSVLDVENFPYKYLWDLFQDAVLGNHLIILCLAFKICYAEPEQCPWIFRFPVRLLRIGTISGPVWPLDTVASNPFKWSLPQLGIVSSHTHTHDNVSTQLKAQKGFSTNSWSPLSLQLSLPCYSVLRIQTALVYQLCLLNSGSWLGFGWVSLPSMWSGNSLKTVSWDNDRVHLTCFLSLKNYCLFLLDAQLLQRRQWHPTPVLLPEKSNGRRSLVGCSPWGR